VSSGLVSYLGQWAIGHVRIHFERESRPMDKFQDKGQSRLMDNIVFGATEMEYVKVCY